MKKILVVEDDKFLLNAYRVKLTKMGFDVKTATDGKEAIEALKDFQADLILLDLVMPIQDGFTTLGQLKKDPKLSPIPVIITSNLGQKEDIEKGMSLGAVDFLTKSDSSLSTLMSKINALLESK